MIKDKNFAQQSALFAQLSAFGYKEPGAITKTFKRMGYTSIFLSNKDAEAYVLEDATDVIIVCRGTQPKQWSDISADLSIDRVKPVTGEGKVHVGFKSYVDKLWPSMKNTATKAMTDGKSLWITGHSLGAAMATMIARECALDAVLQTPEALFTYGSPRVGDGNYVKQLNASVTHHRWVNDGDLVTKMPMPPFYSHGGTHHSIDANGIVTPDIAKKKMMVNLIKLVFGFWSGIFGKLMGDVKDHSIEVYAQRLQFWSLTYEEN